MKIVSPILKRVVYPGLAKAWRLHRWAERGPAVVTYHGILPAKYQVWDINSDSNIVRRDSLARQLQLLKGRYNVISPQQFRLWCESQCPLPPRSVLLTCDDGLGSALTDMVPALLELGLTCLFFVTGNSLSATPSMLWHDELRLMLLEAADRVKLELREPEIRERIAGPAEKRDLWLRLVRRLSHFGRDARGRILEQIAEQLGLAANWRSKSPDDPMRQGRYRTLNLEQTREIVSSGMTVGAHTLSHPMLSQMSESQAYEEIVESRVRIERALEQTVWALAYPFGGSGSVGDREIEMAERAGYKCAFLNVGGGLGAPLNVFAMPRVHVTHDMGLAEFEAHISGFHRSLRQYFLGDAAADGFAS